MLTFPWLMDGITKWEGLAVEKLRYIYPIDAEVTASMLTVPWVMDGITAGESSAISSVFSLMNEYPPFAKEVLDLWWVPDDMPTVERYALRDLHDLARSNLPLARQAIGEPFMGPALAQAGQQHVAGAGGDGQQRVIAPRTGVAVVAGALLGQSVGLADRRIKVDGEWCVAGSGTGLPDPGQQLAAHPVQLADMAPPEAAQEGVQGGGSLSPNPPKDTDGRREDSGRGWVRELQGRWPGVLG